MCYWYDLFKVLAIYPFVRHPSDRQDDVAPNIIKTEVGGKKFLTPSALRLGFYRGSELADPEGLLQGTGKVIRYSHARDLADIPKEAFKGLIQEAVRFNES